MTKVERTDGRATRRAKRTAAAGAARAVSRRAPRRARRAKPCTSTSTSARRTASRASRSSARREAPATRSRRSCVFSASRTAARIAAAHAPPPAAEQARDRLTQLTGAERLVGEERELPAIERLGELAVVVGEREPLAQVGGELRREPCRAGPARREARLPRSAAAAPRASGLKSRRSKTTGPAAIAPAVARRSAVTASASSAAASGGSDSSRCELAAKLEHEQTIDVAAELRRHEAVRFRPQLRDLAGFGRAEPDVAAQVGLGAGGQTDDRRERNVRPRRAEQRVLEVGVGGVERLVVPVEAAAALSSPRQHRQEDRAEERVVVRLREPRVRPREDCGGRLAPQVVDRVTGVGQPPERRRLLLDEPAHERAVLVQRRPVAWSRAPRRRTALARRARPRTPRDRTRAATGRDAGRAAREHLRAARVHPFLAAGTPVRGAVVVADAPTTRSAWHSAGRAARRGDTPAGELRGRRRPPRASTLPPTRAPARDRPPGRRGGGATARAAPPRATRRATCSRSRRRATGP